MRDPLYIIIRFYLEDLLPDDEPHERIDSDTGWEQS